MKQILVIGELNIDMIISGLPSLPVLGQELLGQDMRITLGGSSAICACWMGGLGAPVSFCGKVGTDSFGDFLSSEMQHWGVNTDSIMRDEQTGTGLTISLTYPNDRAMITYLGTIAALQLDNIRLESLSNYAHLHVSSAFLQHGIRPHLPTLFRTAQAAGLTTSLDTGWDPDNVWGEDILGILPWVNFFLPNETEALHLTRQTDIAAAAAMLGRTAQTVAIKLGREGAYMQAGEQIWRVPGFPVTPIDSTGAGDAFDAGFIYAHVIEGRPAPEALQFANACGAIAVTSLGGAAAVPTADQVDTFMALTPTERGRFRLDAM